MIYAPIEGTTVIGLGHKARHGKDTAARFLIEESSGVQRFAFADNVRAICRVLHGMTEKDAPLMQKVGLEYRKADEHVWLRSLYAKMQEDRPVVAVITDVRFENEMAMIRQMGGACWRVDRVMADGSLFVDPSRPADHVSEVALNGHRWDRVIENPDGDLDAFRLAVLGSFRQLVGGDVVPTAAGQMGWLIPSWAKRRA